jgi:hypothetical protein
MQNAKIRSDRDLLLTVINQIPIVALSAFVKHNGVHTLKTWLEIARTENDVELMGKILDIVAKQPVTVDVMKDTQIGKVCTTISKLSGTPALVIVANKAKKLVEDWRLRFLGKTKPKVTTTTPTTTTAITTTKARQTAIITDKSSLTRTASDKSRILPEKTREIDKFRVIPEKTPVGPTRTATTEKTQTSQLQSLPKTVKKKPVAVSTSPTTTTTINTPAQPNLFDNNNSDEATRKRLRQMKLIDTGPAIKKPRLTDKSAVPEKTPPTTTLLTPNAVANEARRKKLIQASQKAEAAKVEAAKAEAAKAEAAKAEAAKAALAKLEVPKIDQQIKTDTFVKQEPGYQTFKVDPSSIPIKMEAPVSQDDSIQSGLEPSPFVKDEIIDQESELPKRPRKKKTVSWAAEDKLVSVRLFRKEESVAGIKNNRSGTKPKESDHLSQLIEYEEDEWTNACKSMQAQIKWRNPDNYKPFDSNKKELNSKQAQIQEDYTNTEYMVAFLKDADIPFTPKEYNRENQKFTDDSDITNIPFVEGGKEEDDLLREPEYKIPLIPESSPSAKRNEGGAEIDKLHNLIQVLVAQNQQQGVGNIPGMGFNYPNPNIPPNFPQRAGMNLPPPPQLFAGYPPNFEDGNWRGGRNDDAEWRGGGGYGKRGVPSGSRSSGGGSGYGKRSGSPSNQASTGSNQSNGRSNTGGYNKSSKGRNQSSQRERNPSR